MHQLGHNSVRGGQPANGRNMIRKIYSGTESGLFRSELSQLKFMKVIILSSY